jgi:enoyl-CoA hydratase/carnithine racemase
MPEPTYETLIYQTRGARAVLTLNRPERRNALSPQLIEDLLSALRAADADPALRVIVVTGTGEKAFCAGGDIGAGGAGEGIVAMHKGRGRFADLFRALREGSKPVVARVNGDALGGGFGLMLACDLVVAADHARFGTPEIQLGLFPYVIMATIFRNVSRKAGMEMVLLGEKFDGARARELGLLNRLVPGAELDAATDAICTRIESLSPAVLALGRRAFHAMSEMSFEPALDYLNSMLTLNTMTDDALEGISAFLQKRAPDWKGR